MLNVRKVNQVIYIMYLNCMIDAITLVLAVSKYFVDKIVLLYEMLKSEKGDNSGKYL